MAMMIVSALDHARRGMYEVALQQRSPTLRSLVVDKDRRIAARALLCVLTAMAIAIASPTIALVVSPLVLGVPHLMSEMRWLLLQRGRPGTRRRSSTRVITFVAFALAIAIASALGNARLEVSFAAIAVAIAGRKSWPFVVAAGLVTACALAPSPFVAEAIRGLAVGVHGFVAIAMWLVLFRRKKKLPFAIMMTSAMLVGIACVALARGPLVAQAFVQSVHYAVWLVLIPDDGAKAAGSPTFRMSARGWKRDVGAALLAAAALVILSLGVLAIALGPSQTRDGYIVLARFHVWLEIAMAAWLFTNRQSISQTGTTKTKVMVHENDDAAC